MTRMVECVKLGRQAEGLDSPPYPGELGQKIYDSISREAWQEWLSHQTMLINEKRLKAFKAEDRKYLQQQMEAFLFGGEVDAAEGYTPPTS